MLYVGHVGTQKYVICDTLDALKYVVCDAHQHTDCMASTFCSLVGSSRCTACRSFRGLRRILVMMKAEKVREAMRTQSQ